MVGRLLNILMIINDSFVCRNFSISLGIMDAYLSLRLWQKLCPWRMSWACSLRFTVWVRVLAAWEANPRHSFPVPCEVIYTSPEYEAPPRGYANPSTAKKCVPKQQICTAAKLFTPFWWGGASQGCANLSPAKKCVAKQQLYMAMTDTGLGRCCPNTKPRPDHSTTLRTKKKTRNPTRLLNVRNSLQCIEGIMEQTRSTDYLFWNTSILDNTKRFLPFVRKSRSPRQLRWYHRLVNGKAREARRLSAPSWLVMSTL